MKAQSLFVFYVTIFLLAPVDLWASKLIFASPENLPPKIFFENGELKGTYVEIIREACKRLKIEAEFQQYPWVRAVNLVENGKVDAIFPPFKNPEREKLFIFPSEPISITRNVIFAQKGRKLQVKSLSDLNPLIVGVNAQYSYGAEFDNYKSQLQIDTSLNEDLLISKLAHKGDRRIDVAAASDEAFKFVAKQRGLQNEFVEVFTISENASYVAFSRSKGINAKALSDKFAVTLRQMKKDGTMKRIFASYGE